MPLPPSKWLGAVTVLKAIGTAVTTEATATVTMATGRVSVSTSAPAIGIATGATVTGNELKVRSPFGL